VTTYEDSDWDRVVNDYPYWNFVENAPNGVRGTGYYHNVYRRIAGTAIPEQAATWAAVFLGYRMWDGLLDIKGSPSRTTLERYSSTLFGKYPRNVMLNRFNYGIANGYQVKDGQVQNGQEGLSFNHSTVIEPSMEAGFNIMYDATSIFHSLLGLIQRSPGMPVVTNRTGTSFNFTSSNYPVEYQVNSLGGGCNINWTYVDPTTATVNLPSCLQSQAFSIQTRNALGASPILDVPYP
jgi:hypothetical protein